MRYLIEKTNIVWELYRLAENKIKNATSPKDWRIGEKMFKFLTLYSPSPKVSTLAKKSIEKIETLRKKEKAFYQKVLSSGELPSKYPPVCKNLGKGTILGLKFNSTKGASFKLRDLDYLSSTVDFSYICTDTMENVEFYRFSLKVDCVNYGNKIENIAEKKGRLALVRFLSGNCAGIRIVYSNLINARNTQSYCYDFVGWGITVYDPAFYPRGSYTFRSADYKDSYFPPAFYLLADLLSTVYILRNWDDLEKTCYSQ